MGNAKSFGNVDLRYDYRIDFEDHCVVEYKKNMSVMDKNIYPCRWYFNEMIRHEKMIYDDKKLYINIEGSKSFLRTKKWVIQNHLELLI
jgi:hypothetical protein